MPGRCPELCRRRCLCCLPLPNGCCLMVWVHMIMSLLAGLCCVKEFRQATQESLFPIITVNSSVALPFYAAAAAIEFALASALVVGFIGNNPLFLFLYLSTVLVWAMTILAVGIAQVLGKLPDKRQISSLHEVTDFLVFVFTAAAYVYFAWVAVELQGFVRLVQEKLDEEMRQFVEDLSERRRAARQMRLEYIRERSYRQSELAARVSASQSQYSSRRASASRVAIPERCSVTEVEIPAHVFDMSDAGNKGSDSYSDESERELSEVGRREVMFTSKKRTKLIKPKKRRTTPSIDKSGAWPEGSMLAALDSLVTVDRRVVEERQVESPGSVHRGAQQSSSRLSAEDAWVRALERALATLQEQQEPELLGEQSRRSTPAVPPPSPAAPPVDDAKAAELEIIVDARAEMAEGSASRVDLGAGGMWALQEADEDRALQEQQRARAVDAAAPVGALGKAAAQPQSSHERELSEAQAPETEAESEGEEERQRPLQQKQQGGGNEEEEEREVVEEEQTEAETSTYSWPWRDTAPGVEHNRRKLDSEAAMHTSAVSPTMSSSAKLRKKREISSAQLTNNQSVMKELKIIHEARGKQIKSEVLVAEEETSTKSIDVDKSKNTLVQEMLTTPSESGLESSATSIASEINARESRDHPPAGQQRRDHVPAGSAEALEPVHFWPWRERVSAMSERLTAEGGARGAPPARPPPQASDSTLEGVQESESQISEPPEHKVKMVKEGGSGSPETVRETYEAVPGPSRESRPPRSSHSKKKARKPSAPEGLSSPVPAHKSKKTTRDDSTTASGVRQTTDRDEARRRRPARRPPARPRRKRAAASPSSSSTSFPLSTSSSNDSYSSAAGSLSSSSASSRGARHKRRRR